MVLDVHLQPGGSARDASIAAIRRVLSFPHASGQCRRFLAENLPDVEVVPTNSTAEAARLVGEERRPDTAALAPRARGRALRPGDTRARRSRTIRTTRPVSWSVAPWRVPAPTGHDKTSIVCFQREDQPGSLHAILSEFSARNINLTKLESRPTKRGLGDYCFLIDLDGHLADEVVADCLRVLHAEIAGVKFLGSYPADRRARPRRAPAGQYGLARGRRVDPLTAEPDRRNLIIGGNCGPWATARSYPGRPEGWQSGRMRGS